MRTEISILRTKYLTLVLIFLFKQTNMKRLITTFKKVTNPAFVCTLFFLAIILFTSCKKDFLNRQALDRIQETNVWSDAGLIESYVNSAYRSVPQGHEFIFGRTLSCLTDECNRRRNSWIL